jgi:hypothetical protein
MHGRQYSLRKKPQYSRRLAREEFEPFGDDCKLRSTKRISFFREHVREPKRYDSASFDEISSASSGECNFRTVGSLCSRCFSS